jgi:hypothetical protein
MQPSGLGRHYARAEHALYQQPQYESKPLALNDHSDHISTAHFLIASGVNGMRRIRSPVASNTAFAIAARTGPGEASPAPTDFMSGLSKIVTLIVGILSNRMTG